MVQHQQRTCQSQPRTVASPSAVRVSADAAIDAIRQGSLRESSDELLMPNHDYRPLQRAPKAVDELQDFLLTSSSDFANWFHEVYDLPPDLRTRHVWDQIV